MGKKLVFDRIIFDWIRSWREPKVDWSKIDKSCLIFSDKPVENKGWIKGWVKDRNKIIITKHANPIVGDFVHIWLNGEKIKRKIVSIDLAYKNYDIVICEIEEDWPSGVKIYKMCKNVKKMQPVCSFHQDSTYSTRRVLLQNDNMLSGTYYTREFIGGDSGLPWFVWEDNQFKICSHTFKGVWGIGPNYTKIFDNRK